MTRRPDAEVRSVHHLADHVAIFQPEDRVIVERESFYYKVISEGSRGTVVGPVSYVTHATANGGGYDVSVLLDDGYNDALGARRTRLVTIRSTAIRRI